MRRLLALLVKTKVNTISSIVLEVFKINYIFKWGVFSVKKAPQKQKKFSGKKKTSGDTMMS